jgi:hypothetical protein
MSARRQQPEHAIQVALVQHLRLRVKPSVLWWHTPNGGRRDAVTGAMLKRAGTLAGVSDLLAFRPGACPDCSSARLEGFALELKADGGRPTDSQLDFQAKFNECGGHSAVCDDLNRALAVLESWQLLRGRAS